MEPRVATRAIAPDKIPTDPLSLLSVPAAGATPRFYWSSPTSDQVVVGYGVAAELRVSGAGRFSAIADAAVELGGDSMSQGTFRPRMFVSFGFGDETPRGPEWQGFSAGWIAVPEVALVLDRDRATLAIADSGARTGADAQDPEELLGFSGSGESTSTREATRDQIDVALELGTGDELTERVEGALAAIDSGEVDKVVVATSCSIELPDTPDHVALLRSLRQQQPGCFHFLVSPAPEVAFLGASPERLVSLDGTSLRTVALAGSARRDPDPEIDRALGSALMSSAKERREHKMVVDAIERELADCPLEAAPEPGLRRLATIQHLETEIRAEVPVGRGVLDWAGRLHPTPALGGTPKARASRLIGELEGDSRGMYGGPVGWVDGAGNGDLCVAIRSMLVRGTSITAFAGAGIVRGSDPESEVYEMRRKLEVSLGALVG